MIYFLYIVEQEIKGWHVDKTCMPFLCNNLGIYTLIIFTNAGY